MATDFWECVKTQQAQHRGAIRGAIRTYEDARMKLDEAVAESLDSCDSLDAEPPMTPAWRNAQRQLDAAAGSLHLALVVSAQFRVRCNSVIYVVASGTGDKCIMRIDLDDESLLEIDPFV